jgi:AcrR family transcriptional regulator
MNEESSTRERRHQRTRDAILTTARRIVHEKGPDGLSMREIARRIDYSPAGLYEYFGSKEEIIGELCAEGFRRLTAHLLLPDPALPSLEYLLQQGLNYVAFARANADFFLLMFTTAPLFAPQGFVLGDAEVDSLEAVLLQSPAFLALFDGVVRAVREGALRDQPERPPFALAMTLWHAVHGAAMLEITVGHDLPSHQLTIEGTLRTVIAGMRVV